MLFTRPSVIATFVLACVLPPVMSSPAPIDTTLPDLVTPKNSLNELSMKEYVGGDNNTSSTITPSASVTLVSPSAATSASTSHVERLSTTNSWQVGILAIAGVIATIL